MKSRLFAYVLPGVDVIAVFDILRDGKQHAQFLAEREVKRRQTKCAVVEAHESNGFMTMHEGWMLPDNATDKELVAAAKTRAQEYIKQWKNHFQLKMVRRAFYRRNAS